MYKRVKFIDLFAGGGGVSSGAKMASINKQHICDVIFAVNHDPIAIATHAENHPETEHFVEDIRDLGVIEKIKVRVDELRAESSENLIILHASMECTHHSIAKGGGSRDPDSRSLPEYMPLYLKAFMPEYFTVENVKEFLTWGPLMIKMKKFDGEACMLEYSKKEKRLKPFLIPDPKQKCLYYNRWVKEIEELGYEYQYRILNSADFGANTSRPRYFGIFAKKGLPIEFPVPTHSKTPTGNKKQWNAVRPCLDLTDKGESIFAKKKMPVEKTLQRILAGLIKQVAKGDDSFIMKYYSSKKPGVMVQSLDVPAGSVLIKDTFGLVSVEPFMIKYLGNNQKTGVNNGKSIDEPCITISTQNRLGLVTPVSFLDSYYGNGYSSGLDVPCPVISTKDRFSLISAENQYMCHDYSGGSYSKIDAPCWSLTTTPKANLVTAEGFILNPHYFGNATSLDSPAPVVIARQDKSPMSVVKVETGEAIIRIFPTDSETLIKIKCFMAYYGISDIKMRMLKVSELKRIQGFDESYILKGNQTDQKRMIGNAVVPIAYTRLLEATCKPVLKVG